MDIDSFALTFNTAILKMAQQPNGRQYNAFSLVVIYLWYLALTFVSGLLFKEDVQNI